MSEMSYQDWRKKEAKAVSKMKIKFGGILNDEEKDLKEDIKTKNNNDKNV